LRADAHLISIILVASFLSMPGAAFAQWWNYIPICHKPGTPAEQYMTMNWRAVPAHINHGDIQGQCPERPKADVSALLSGFSEVPPISSDAGGIFMARLERDDRMLEYRLAYRDLSDEILSAHIHFGQETGTGGVIAWLCAAPGTSGAPSNTPTCEGLSGIVEGSLGPDDVVGPEDQGIEPGEADAALEALRGGFTYVNVHSAAFPSGEIRGQIGSSDVGRYFDERLEDFHDEDSDSDTESDS
jgi:hypothetical protein